MTLNADKVKKQFENEGISISQWAKTKGYNIRTVYAVLRGELNCSRGISHSIAVDLGLKKRISNPVFKKSSRNG